MVRDREPRHCIATVLGIRSADFPRKVKASFRLIGLDKVESSQTDRFLGPAVTSDLTAAVPGRDAS